MMTPPLPPSFLLSELQSLPSGILPLLAAPFSHLEVFLPLAICVPGGVGPTMRAADSL